MSDKMREEFERTNGRDHRRSPPKGNNYIDPMDRRSRALWQDAAARKRQWYAKPGFIVKRSSGVVADVRFGHGALMMFARRGDTFDPYWWA